MNKVDHIFVLNLDARTDRLKQVTDHLDSLGINNWERFPGIKVNISRYPNNLYNKMHRRNQPYINGSLGCRLSMTAMLKLARKRGYKNIMILEDDVIFTSTELSHIDKAISYLNTLNRWDILYLGANNVTVPLNIPNHPYVAKVKRSYATHAYIVNHKAFDKIINETEKFSGEIDVYYAENLQKEGHSYIIKPYLCTQRVGKSDVIGTIADYRKIINKK